MFSSSREAFALVKKLLDFSPQVVLTDDSEAEQKALKIIFPNAVLLLCAFHVLQSVFRWLINKENNIPRSAQNVLIKSECYQ